MAERKLYAAIFTTLIVGLTVMAAATPTLAGQANNQFGTGFFEGIDPLDGSIVQLSLTDNDQDGVIEFIFRESFFTSCFTNKNKQGRGVVIGTATVVEPGVIEAVADRICINDDNTKEAPFEIIISILAAPKGDILITQHPGFPDIILHRTGE